MARMKNKNCVSKEYTQLATIPKQIAVTIGEFLERFSFILSFALYPFLPSLLRSRTLNPIHSPVKFQTYRHRIPSIFSVTEKKSHIELDIDMFLLPVLILLYSHRRLFIGPLNAHFYDSSGFRYRFFPSLSLSLIPCFFVAVYVHSFGSGSHCHMSRRNPTHLFPSYFLLDTKPKQSIESLMWKNEDRIRFLFLPLFVTAPLMIYLGQFHWQCERRAEYILVLPILNLFRCHKKFSIFTWNGLRFNGIVFRGIYCYDCQVN